jgi:hypothetical protein
VRSRVLREGNVLRCETTRPDPSRGQYDDDLAIDNVVAFFKTRRVQGASTLPKKPNDPAGSVDLMDPCDLYADWADIAGTSEQLDGLQDLADAIFEQWGLEGVTVVFGDVDGDDYGEYDPSTNTITIDLDGLTDPNEAIDTVFHESIHALHDQWGFSVEETVAMHESIEVDADFLTNELLADCVSTDPAESGATATIPDIPGTINIVGDPP